MNDSENYFKARAAAGRAAVVVANDHPHDVAVETISGLAGGFVLALAEMQGWDMTLAYIFELARSARPPVEPQTPKLHIVGAA